jgi:hypothetical protein
MVSAKYREVIGILFVSETFLNNFFTSLDYAMIRSTFDVETFLAIDEVAHNLKCFILSIITKLALFVFIRIVDVIFEFSSYHFLSYMILIMQERIPIDTDWMSPFDLKLVHIQFCQDSLQICAKGTSYRIRF